MRILASLGTLGLILFGVLPTASAQTPADHEAVRNHIICYPTGIDTIGRGEFDAGVSAWKQCFSQDFAFSLFFGRGEPIDCPGAKCPMPATMSATDMRAAMAKRAFETGGYQKTSHHLTNVKVTFASADRAVVNAYLQAWHWKADGVVIAAAGTWDVDVVREGSGWRIAKEKLAIVGAGALAAPSR